MNTELTHNQVLELLPAYALGALEPEEMLAVDTYLNNNRALLDRLRQAELAAAQMAYTAPDAPLPAQAKGQLLARVQADLATPEGVDAALPPAPLPAKSSDLVQPKTAPSHSEGWWAGFRRAFGSTPVWAAATGCAVVVIAVLGFYLAQAQTQLAALQTTNTELEQINESLQQQLLTNKNELQQASADLDTLQAQTAQLQAANTQLQQQAQGNQELLAVLSGANLKQTIPLPGTADAPGANGTFYLTTDNQMVLVLHGLEPLPAEQTYELWLIPADGSPAPAGLLAVQTVNPTWLKLEALPEIPDFAAVGVSVEPAGGSAAPTGPIVLLGTVS